MQPHVAPVLGGTNWTPLGPAGATRGQTRNLATVGGRILSIEVGPLGARAYAAAADGGVWQYDKVTIGAVSHDVWTPVDDFATSPNLVNLARGNALAGSALLVQFGADARADTLFVGTGEGGMDLTTLPVDQGPSYLGIGVRVSPGSAVAGPRVWQARGRQPAGSGRVPPVPGSRRPGGGLGGGEQRALSPAHPVGPEHAVDAGRRRRRQPVAGRARDHRRRHHRHHGGGHQDGSSPPPVAAR